MDAKDIARVNSQQTAWTPYVGDIVAFKGTVHYASSDAKSGSACKPGKARIFKIYKAGKHPYALVRVEGGGSNVYGWVDAGTFTKA